MPNRVNLPPFKTTLPQTQPRRTLLHYSSVFEPSQPDTARAPIAAILGVSGDEAIHGILDIMNAGSLYPTLQ
jgi:hypothetical protein